MKKTNEDQRNMKHNLNDPQGFYFEEEELETSGWTSKPHAYKELTGRQIIATGKRKRTKHHRFDSGFHDKAQTQTGESVVDYISEGNPNTQNKINETDEI